jgi:hypothetical protein
MKANRKNKLLTFGELIVAGYDATGKRQARGIIRLALHAHLIKFRTQQRFVISE